MGISSIGYTYSFPGVPMQGRNAGAYLYADRKGNRWTVTPLSANRLRIAGRRVENGTVAAVACNGPEATADTSANVPGMTTTPGRTYRFACNDSFRFEVVMGAHTGS